MRNYFYDCEFLEGTQTKRFLGIPLPWKTKKPTIDLISIGVVPEKDGPEYYAICSDFNIAEAWNRWQYRTGCGDGNNTHPREYWIRENVLRPIFEDLVARSQQDPMCPFYKLKSMPFTYKSVKDLIQWYGKSKERIAQELQSFTDTLPSEKWDIKEYGDSYRFRNSHYTQIFYKSSHTLESAIETLDERIKPFNLYGYYSAYDHVVLCWIFGKMINLPKYWPMYTKDLKQIFDEKQLIHTTDLKSVGNYPKQLKGEHTAIEDAKWNRELFNFLKNV